LGQAPKTLKLAQVDLAHISRPSTRKDWISICRRVNRML